MVQKSTIIKWYNLVKTTSGSTVLVKPRQKEQAWLEQGWAVGQLARLGRWNVLEHSRRILPTSSQVDRFSKAKGNNFILENNAI